MNQNTCESCSHYIQHYTFDDQRFVRICCGHCTYGRVRVKKPDAKICENYIQAKSAAKPFATKEYLTKKLLDYVLRLELTPEIEDS